MDNLSTTQKKYVATQLAYAKQKNPTKIVRNVQTYNDLFELFEFAFLIKQFTTSTLVSEYYIANVIAYLDSINAPTDDEARIRLMKERYFSRQSFIFHRDFYSPFIKFLETQLTMNIPNEMHETTIVQFFAKNLPYIEEVVNVLIKETEQRKKFYGVYLMDMRLPDTIAASTENVITSLLATVKEVPIEDKRTLEIQYKKLADDGRFSFASTISKIETMKKSQLDHMLNKGYMQIVKAEVENNSNIIVLQLIEDSHIVYYHKTKHIFIYENIYVRFLLAEGRGEIIYLSAQGLGVQKMVTKKNYNRILFTNSSEEEKFDAQTKYLIHAHHLRNHINSDFLKKDTQAYALKKYNQLALFIRQEVGASDVKHKVNITSLQPITIYRDIQTFVIESALPSDSTAKHVFIVLLDEIYSGVLTYSGEIRDISLVYVRHTNDSPIVPSKSFEKYPQYAKRLQYVIQLQKYGSDLRRKVLTAPKAKEK